HVTGYGREVQIDEMPTGACLPNPVTCRGDASHRRAPTHVHGLPPAESLPLQEQRLRVLC
ncbi:MAG TPA: hypothetical protein VH164_18170, partial [Ktedonobacteraceae bacterium]|nr:hypothetical protein [Ktedonobacteraceae bacterium]